jgi:GWxTD domain-containing protein
MNKYTSFVWLFLSVAVHAQPLRDINYVYQYNPGEAFSFEMNAIKKGGDFVVLYSLVVKDTTGFSSEYSIDWEGRSLLIDKNGVDLSLSTNDMSRNASGMQGQATVIAADAPKYLVAKVIRNSMKRAWVFYVRLDAHHPVNNYLTRNGSPVIDPFIRTGEQVALAGDSGEWMVSYYDDNFPAAAPAFSEGQARVSRGMQSDSTFNVRAGEPLTFSKKGLYLIQRDTTALEGFAFRAEDDYPQYSKLTNLAGPLIYISTKQEFDRLELSNGNKKTFDRVVLNITADTERARTLMRSYFRRVELANKYFTSYKEGWKTDRGMMLIIFGLPQEVFRFEEREVWNYDNDTLKGSFSFSRSSSLFDPDNYVLIRNNKFKDEWYEVIDLWRNARF